MIKAVLFDLDGTLANSLKDLANAVNYALSLDNYPLREVEEFKMFVGDGMPKMIERALPEGHKDADTVARMLKYVLEHYSVHYADNTCSYKGVPELIESLKEMGLIVAVVTNKVQEMADIVVEKLYGNAFEKVFGKREGVPAKPDPTMALLAMEELGVKPDECVFIGDSGMDVATGVNSGALPVGELWGFRGEEELRANGAKYIISDPSELIEIIKEANK
ncbi:MAG: HAD family hydrolase [Clostridia bacterium]|nr:HAD family hydrolase [Clostridia bacterium]